MVAKLTITAERVGPGKLRVSILNDSSIPVPIFVHDMYLYHFDIVPARRGKSESLKSRERIEAKAAWKTRQTQFNPGTHALLEITYDSTAELEPLCLAIEFRDGSLKQIGSGWSYERTYPFTAILNSSNGAWTPYENPA